MKWLRFFLIAVLLISCNFQPGKIDPPSWKPQLLGPLAVHRTTMGAIFGPVDHTLDYGITMEDLGFKPGNYTRIPAIDTFLGPFVLRLTDAFEKLKLNGAALTIKFKNQLPIDILKGTILVLKDKSGKEIFSYVLDQTLKSEGGALTLSLPGEIKEVVTSTDVYFSLDPVLTSGREGPLMISGKRTLSISIILGKLHYGFAVTQKENNLRFTVTADFNLKGDIVETQPVEGDFILYVRNGLPLKFRLQAYFWNQDRTVFMDSLFSSPMVIRAPPVDNNGKSKGTVESSDTVKVSNTRIRKLQDAAILSAYFQMETTGNQQKVTLYDKDSLAVQLIGNLKLHVKK